MLRLAFATLAGSATDAVHAQPLDLKEHEHVLVRVVQDAARERSGLAVEYTEKIKRELEGAGPAPGLEEVRRRLAKITEMAETGATDATRMALAGHMSRAMLEHYSHVRTAAKRTVLDKLESGLMGERRNDRQPAAEKVN